MKLCSVVLQLFIFSWWYAFCVLFIAVYKKAELAKKTEVQAHSPSRKFILKPAIKYTRPTHLSCVKRKTTGDCSILQCGWQTWTCFLLFWFFFLNLITVVASSFVFLPRISAVMNNFAIKCLVSLFFLFFPPPCRRGHDHLFLCHAQT